MLFSVRSRPSNYPGDKYKNNINSEVFPNIRGWVRKFCHRCYIFVNRHDKLLYDTLIERATFLLYNDAKRMPERKKYFEIDRHVS